MAPSNRPAPNKKSRQRRERRQSFVPSVPKTEKRTIGRSTTGQTPLHVRVRGLDDFDDAMRDYARVRTGFKLGKYALRITRITVRFENVAGPKGAPAVACRFKVVLAGRGEVVVATTESSTRAAFDAAVDATERAVRRLLGRVRKTAKRSAAGPRAIRGE